MKDLHESSVDCCGDHDLVADYCAYHAWDLAVEFRMIIDWTDDRRLECRLRTDGWPVALS